MNKLEYIERSFAIIRAKNLQVPFEIASGITCPDLEKYLESLRTSYLANKGDLEQLFFDKIEHLKKL